MPPIVHDVSTVGRGPQTKIAGNNGDSLIEMGTARLFDRLKLELVDDAREADAIVIGGGGHLIEGFTAGPPMLRDLSAAHPEIPLVVLPSSVYFPTERFEDLLPSSREADITIFCRERYSARHLTEDHDLPSFCRVELDHDMAFELMNTPLVDRVRSGEPRHVLVVERWDLEHPEKKLRRGTGDSLRLRLTRLMPESLRAPLRPLVAWNRGRRRSRFMTAAESIITALGPEQSRSPRVTRDISLPNYASFDEFVEAISQASLIITTRLHVGILGAMGGRNVVLFEGGYWKARGIHEYSMTDLPNIQFRDLDEMDRNISS